MLYMYVYIYIYVCIRERETYCIDTYAIIRTYVYIYIIYIWCIYKCVWLYIWFFLDVVKFMSAPRSDAFAAVLRRLVMPAIWTCPTAGKPFESRIPLSTSLETGSDKEISPKKLGISPANTGLSEIPTMIFTGLIYKGLLDLLWNSIWDGSVGFPDGHGSNMIKPSTWKPS